jgi:hypothetical protein
MTRQDREAIDELLCQAATDSLTAAEAARLETLLAANPDVDRSAFERAAGLVLLAAFGAAGDPMPASLRRSLQQVGERELSLRR